MNNLTFLLFALTLTATTAACNEGVGKDDADAGSDADAQDSEDTGDAIPDPVTEPDVEAGDVTPDPVSEPDVEPDTETDTEPDVEEDAVDDPPAEDMGVEDVPEELDASDTIEVPESIVWVPITGGTFEMGCSTGDTECYPYESPRHTVTVSDFEMTETEITQAQYEAVTGTNPSRNAGCDECPVEMMTWFEAKSFCEAIDGRLPSEAEWEYAARGGTTTRYYCGDAASCLDGIAWYDANSSDVTHLVAQKTANAFGLYDMLGNVHELMEECWHSNYTGAPSTGEVWTGGDCSGRVFRGGSGGAAAIVLRVSFRYYVGPSERHGYVGIRCVRDAT